MADSEKHTSLLHNCSKYQCRVSWCGPSNYQKRLFWVKIDKNNFNF